MGARTKEAAVVANLADADLGKKPGRKPRFTSPEDLQNEIDKYFVFCDEFMATKINPKTGEKTKFHSPKPYTIAGLVLFIGLSSRQALTRYASIDDDYGEVVARAFLKIEAGLSESVIAGQGAAAGQIFSLKACFGWHEKSEQSVPLAVQVPSQVNITVNNSGIIGMPPQFDDISAWEAWYRKSNGQAAHAALPEAVEEACFVELPVDQVLDEIS